MPPSVPSATTARHEPDDTERWIRDRLPRGRAVPSLLIVVGLGDGAVLDHLEKRTAPVRVLALEPDAGAARLLLAHPSVRRWLDAGHLTCLCGPEYEGADQAWRLFSTAAGSHVTLAGPGAALLDRSATEEAAAVLKRILFGVKANAEARHRFAPRYLTNTLRNLPSMAGGRDVSALRGACAGQPAIVAAAGPSLDRAATDLRLHRSRAVLIAADTALRPLLLHGVTPDYVVGLDPSERNARHFLALSPCARTQLVAESALDPAAVAPFAGRATWFRVANHHPWPWLQEMGLDVASIEVWGSVLTAAFQLALLAGCDPIVIVGADLAYTDDQPYCRGTTYEFDWGYSAALGDALYRAWRHQCDAFDRVDLPDLRGGVTRSTAPLRAFRDWLAAQAARSGRRVVNATGAGILFGSGIEIGTIAAALGSPDTPPPDTALIEAAVASHGWPEPSLGRLRTQVDDLAARVVSHGALDDLLARWLAFCGPALSLPAIAVALGEASTRLAQPPPADSLGQLAPAPWQARVDADVLGRAMRQLPESIARLGSVLSGAGVPEVPEVIEPLEGPTSGDQPWELLQAALTLVDAVHANVKTLERTATGAARALLAHVRAERLRVPMRPLSGLHRWDPEIGWPLQVFEALLGQGWRVRGHGQSASFISRPGVEADRMAPPTPKASDALPAADLDSPSPRDHDGSLSEWLAAEMALEWLACAASTEVADTTARQRLQVLLAAATSARRRSSVLVDDVNEASDIDAGNVVNRADRATSHESWLTLSFPPSEGRDIAIEIPAGPIDLNTTAATRALTGLVRTDLEGQLSVELVGFGPADRRAIASIGRRGSGLRRPGSRTTWRSRLLAPRVLTDEGVHRASLVHSDGARAVCAPLHGAASFCITQEGRVMPHLSWPRSICGIAPLGEAGALAWSNGTDRWPETGAGYLMYRREPEAPVVIEELPFRPSAGTWYHGRFHWACFPAGLGSWAPGQPAILKDEHASHLAVSLVGRNGGEDELSTAPCRRTADGGLVRTKGRPGPATCRSAGQGWTAFTHPEADAVRLEAASGDTRWLTCDTPFSAAWAGRSLLVATIDGELLFFQDLADQLDARR